MRNKDRRIGKGKALRNVLKKINLTADEKGTYIGDMRIEQVTGIGL